MIRAARLSAYNRAIMTLRSALVLGAFAASLVVVACGSDEPAAFSTSGSTSSSSTSASSTVTGSGGAGGAGGAVASTGVGGAGGESTATTTASTGGAGGAGGTGAATSTTGAGGMGQGGAPACEAPGDPCNDCMFAQCNTTFCDCVASPGCSAIAACLDGCAAGDSACSQGCIDAQPSGVAEIALIGDCAATTCAASCNNPAPVDPCQVCLASHCEVELEACLADVECVALIACVSACLPGDQACVQTCGFQHLGGVQEGQSLGNCSTASCSVECG